jgi:predicted esterase
MSDKLSFTHRFVKGMPRFFRRHAEGVLDEEDVRRRAHELADFIALTAR